MRLISQLTLIAGSAAVSAAQGPGLPEDFPRLFFLADDRLSGDLQRMAHFDVVNSPFWSQEGPHAVRLDSLRMLNPEIIRLAYVNAAGKSLPDLGQGHVANQLAAAIHDSWLVRNEMGQIVYPAVEYPNVPVINLSTRCPRVNGKTWGEFIADFVPLEILSSGKWEGVYWDNIWNGAAWMNDFIPGSVDLDRNGVADHPDSADAWWNAGQTAMLTRFRNHVGPDLPDIGNGNSRVYGPLNGRFFEDFPYRETWTGSMQQTTDWQTFGHPPSLIGMMTRSAETDYKRMRYGLCSTLIAGTFSCHHSDHHAGVFPVMYDEYLVDLGRPVGPPVELGVDMVGQTDFEGGVPAQFSTECGPGVGVVTTSPTEVIEGIRSLRGEAETGYGPWHLYLCSNPPQLPLLANVTYTVTFKYRILQAPPGDGYFYVSARSDVNQSASVRGVINLDPPAGTVGEVRAEVTLGNYPGYYLFWGMKNEGRIVIDSIRVTKGRGGVFTREFQNGLALVNPTATTLVIPIQPGFRRIMGTLDPITNNGLPVNQVALVPEDGLVLVRATAPVDPPDPPESPPPAADVLRAYPNPVSMADESVIEIAGVPPGGGIDIVSPTGRVMRRIESANSAGKWQWDLRHGNGRRAGAGVYFAAIRNAAGGLVGSLRLALHP